MSRADRELRLCYEILKQSFTDDECLLYYMNEDWHYLYGVIRDEGWDALEDEEVTMLYNWAEEKGLFKFTTPYCTTR